MNFAVLYCKPIILIDSKEYESLLKAHIEAWRSALGLTKINISEKWIINMNKINVNNKKYVQYKEQYIKEPGTPEKYVWDIFCDYLDSLNE